jgi:hypothetical protein
MPGHHADVRSPATDHALSRAPAASAVGAAVNMPPTEITYATQELTTPTGLRFLLGAYRDGVHVWSVTLIDARDVVDRTICGIDAAPDRDVSEDDEMCEGCESVLFRILSTGGMTS